MSLINEALKRTRDAAANPTAVPRPPAVEYRVTATTESGTRRFVVWLLAVGVICAIVAVGLCEYMLKKSPSVVTPLEEFGHALPPPPKPGDIPEEKPGPLVLPPPAAKVTAPVEQSAAAKEDQLVARVVEKMKAEPVPVPPVTPAPSVVPEPPKFTLQGITSDGVAREAMINGTEVSTGDEIDGAKVVSIETHVVKLKFGDKEIVLRMP